MWCIGSSPGRGVATLALTGLATMALVLSAAAQPIPPNVDVSVMPGNEAEDAIAVNPTNPTNVVAMSTPPDVPSGLFEGVSFDGGNTWTRQIIGAGDALGEICCDEQLAWSSTKTRPSGKEEHTSTPRWTPTVSARQDSPFPRSWLVPGSADSTISRFSRTVRWMPRRTWPGTEAVVLTPGGSTSSGPRR